eukprot:73891-Prorocentrum_minimum.AAC.3
MVARVVLIPSPRTVGANKLEESKATASLAFVVCAEIVLFHDPTTTPLSSVKYVQAVGGGRGHGVQLRVPCEVQQLRTEICAAVRHAVRLAGRSLRVSVPAPAREPQAAGDLRRIDLRRGSEATLRGLARLKRGVCPARTVEHAEKVAVGTCGHILTVPADGALKFVKDGVVLVEVAQLQPAPQATQTSASRRMRDTSREHIATSQETDVE